MTRSSDRRVWARLTVDFADSPKVAGLSDAAFRTLVEMILWSRKMMTDGVIPASVARRRWGAKTQTETHSVTESVTDSLTDSGTHYETDPVTELCTNHPTSPSLTRMRDGGYMIHDFLDHQESAEEVIARNARNSANGRRGGRPRKTQTETHSVTESVTDSLTDSGTQTKPKPKAELELELEEEVLRTSSLSPATPESARATTKPRKRHKPTTPIPDDWEPTPEHRARAAAAGVDVDHEAEMFRAHAEANDRWQASWNAAFTTWLGKSAQRAAEQRSRQGYRNQAQIMQDVHRQAQEATIAMRRQQGSALQLIAGEAS